MPDRRVLVVGTTSDYIALIYRRFPGRALFLTETKERTRPSVYLRPAAADEVLCDLSRPEEALSILKDHLEKHRLRLSGIACFDCESLALAAAIARSFTLPFASPKAVAASRDKFFSKRLWRNAGLPCPEVELVHSPSDAIRFLRALKRPAVLKPLTGSGSELVFLCRNDGDCLQAFHTLLLKLGTHPNHRMYGDQYHGGERIDSRRAFVIEESVEGEEFSCDFALTGDRLEIIRMTKKVPARDHSFGTVLAYLLPAELPSGIDGAAFRRQLHRAAWSLGLDRSICMLDFIVREGRAVMIEMTPRPGGDCLPDLERLSSGFDILGYTLDFAEGRETKPPEPSRWERLAGLHLLAERAGTVRAIDDRHLQEDPRVLKCRLAAGPGHPIRLPPDDYDSRKLGHLIFRPSSPEKFEEECLELRGKLRLELEAA